MLLLVCRDVGLEHKTIAFFLHIRIQIHHFIKGVALAGIISGQFLRGVLTNLADLTAHVVLKVSDDFCVFVKDGLVVILKFRILLLDCLLGVGLCFFVLRLGSLAEFGKMLVLLAPEEFQLSVLLVFLKREIALAGRGGEFHFPRLLGLDLLKGFFALFGRGVEVVPVIILRGFEARFAFAAGAAHLGILSAFEISKGFVSFETLLIEYVLLFGAFHGEFLIIGFADVLEIDIRFALSVVQRLLAAIDGFDHGLVGVGNILLSRRLRVCRSCGGLGMRTPDRASRKRARSRTDWIRHISASPRWTRTDCFRRY